MPSSLGRNLESVMKSIEINDSLPLDTKVPVEPAAFYGAFGYLIHPASGLPIERLAEYQLETWKLFHHFRRVLEIKTQKAGESTKWLIADFQLALLPKSHPMSCRGYDQLIVAQTKDHAKEHLRTLRKLIINSKKYNGWLIDRPQEIEEFGESSLRNLMRSEQSKTSVIFIRNPDNEQAPSRIIALGLDNPGALASWKNVKHIHMSDPTMAIGDITEALNYAVSRLANTNGSMVIESPPGLPAGPIYDMYQKYLEKTLTGQLKPGDFCVTTVTSDQALAAGVISKEFLDAERERDPQMFRRLYMAEFVSTGGNVFSVKDIEAAIELGKKLEDKYGLKPSRDTRKALGADPGFGSSNFGECVVQRVDGVLQVIFADEEKLSSDSKSWTSDSAFQGHVRKVKEIYQRMLAWNVQTAMLDGSNASFVRNLKLEFNERTDYENVPEEQHRSMTVQPVAFGKYHKEMLGHVESLMQRHWVAISPKFTKLIDACRTATAVDGKLDKENTLYDDLFDAFRLACFRFKVVNK
jgi:hypothetical protein